ncbi:Endo-beta-1,6-galactanase [Colletotrichum trifolii]|uniref:Endo-beta-1,6-galactanase n=1 Tax=Colletotrichum trifolii TaxID=5466 RepID=A0A4R8PUI8_COLTR|nr:Endo-beta-1,6-galactanase [Colletotrichum trifolii]TDZ29461.1 Endo-beta-1,6-galactanase [Colletotrichum trifolii]
MGRINVHGYQYDEGLRHVLRDHARQRGHGLWNTEYGENDASGKGVLINIFLDFRYLQAQAWVYWQVLDGKGWGLIEADNEEGTLGPANQKYFMVAQFSRHIREGMQILDGGADNIIAAYDEGESKLVIVAVNWWVPQYFNFDLSSFSQPSTHGASVTRWRTRIGEGDRYVKAAEDTFMNGSKFWSYFESGMVQTFEIENIKL